MPGAPVALRGGVSARVHNRKKSGEAAPEKRRARRPLSIGECRALFAHIVFEARMNGSQNLTETVVTQASLSNRRDWKYFDEKLGELRRHDVENIIARGRLLIEAHDELERGSYEATVKHHMDLGDARKYRIIAAHPIISHRGHVHALPPSMRTLYELTRLRPDVLREKLNDGSINPKLERKTVAAWRNAERGEQNKLTVDGKVVERKPPSAKAKLTGSDGSLFDLKADNVGDIAAVIAANISESKATALAKAILEEVKRVKRKQQRPAG
jgi:hypothetical protein